MNRYRHSFIQERHSNANSKWSQQDNRQHQHKTLHRSENGWCEGGCFLNVSKFLEKFKIFEIARKLPAVVVVMQEP
jgi:hypothetical protein